MGLEATLGSHTNLMPGKEKKGSCQGNSMPMSMDHVRTAAVPQGQHWAGQADHCTETPPGHPPGTHRDVCQENPLGPGDKQGGRWTHWAPWAAQGTAEGLGRCLMKCMADGSARVGPDHESIWQPLCKQDLHVSALRGAQHLGWGVQMLSG